MGIEAISNFFLIGRFSRLEHTRTYGEKKSEQNFMFRIICSSSKNDVDGNEKVAKNFMFFVCLLAEKKV